MIRYRILSVLAVLSLLIIAGCLYQTTTRDAITAEDIKTRDPLDGSYVYPLHIVTMGNGKIVSKFAVPLDILKRKMQLPSQKVIASADCGILSSYANDTKLAREALDTAIVYVESNADDSASIRSVTSLKGKESDKFFKGEPHERACMYIFRGLLYLADNDPQNAKSCFIQATLSDALAEDANDRSNWLCADILTALSFKLYGDQGRATDYLAMIRKNYVGPKTATGSESAICDYIETLAAENMTIVIVACGQPPVKYGQDALGYVDSGSRVGSVDILHNGSTENIWLTDDVYVQAVTRGRRSMDEFLEQKQSHKKSSNTLGSAAIGGAVIVSGPIGLAAQLVIGAMMDKNTAVDIDADSRFLGSIPGRFYLWATNSIKPGEEITIQINNNSGLAIARGSLTAPENTNGPNIILAWFPY